MKLYSTTVHTPQIPINVKRIRRYQIRSYLTLCLLASFRVLSLNVDRFDITWLFRCPKRPLWHLQIRGS